MLPETDSCVVSSKSDSNLDFCKKGKKVRFADALGLSLVSVYVIPQRKQQSLRNGGLRQLTPNEDKQALILNFMQPICCPDFVQRVERLNVCLESISFKNCAVLGVIKVRNLAYDKHVSVRYTIDNWKTFQDLPANYMHGSSNGRTDSFSFEISLNEALENECRLEMAFCYEVLGTRFWDNNHGDNYRVKCFSTKPKIQHQFNFCNTLELYRTSRSIGDVGVWF